MPAETWFLFDLGNTVIKLAYERVLENLRRQSRMTRDELVDLLEQAGGYRDMERGAITFWEFYEFLCDRADYRGSIREFHELWSDFFDGPILGIEDVLERVRARYRVAFLSNTNEIHAELIPRRFAVLFRKDDRFVFSYRFRVAKPDPEFFQRALEVVGALAHHTIYVDDLVENVIAARSLGMKAFQFRDSMTLLQELESEGLLPPV
ncbi:MAG: glucose-phosphatase [Acidobacteria bacterium]|jgi:HAD superfamily hydrolase (TIGR01509 family)|nr:glucose-phosphatase [Acidobacteriota bacterium]